MDKTRKTVLLAAIVLILGWAVPHLRGGTDDADWFVRLTLGCLMAFGLLAGRPRTGAAPGFFDARRHWLPGLAAAAAGLSVLGIVIPVRQFEWLGIILLLFAALRWSLPASYRRNILLALFLLYWVHPLPGQVFASFQLAMQRMSIVGAEWFLHIFNHRIWADGFVLRIGLDEFGVPEECSGMRTSVTVLLCTLGVGMLLRLRVRAILAFLVLNAAQVLALNILRISVIVHMAVRQGTSLSPTVLHDTAGIFLLAAILLSQAEMVWWKRISVKRRLRARAIERGDYERPAKSSSLPRFWYVLSRSVIWVLVAAVLGGAIALAAYKRRPFHRTAMIRELADTVMIYRPRIAERALREALRLTPDDREAISMLIEALVRGEHYAEALRTIENAPPPLSDMEMAMKSWALAGLERMEEAAAIMAHLPEHLANLPGMAIFRAEYAVRMDDPIAAGRFARRAARTHVFIPRVRNLFPYLAANDQWAAIADSYHRNPHLHLEHVILEVHANNILNRPEVAGRVLRQALNTWPLEKRLLDSLARFAAMHPGSDWEKRYEENLRANLDTLDTDRLAAAIGQGFRMRRPDLAWLTYRRLEELDPADPALYLAAARHVREWFVFRRRHVEMHAADAAETVDMRDNFIARRADPAFRPHWERVPLVAEMLDGHPEEIRSRYLKMCVDELARREAAGELSRRMQQMYPTALGMLGETEEAQRRLAMIAERYPDARAEILLQQALNHERRAEWQSAYEKLRQYLEITPFPTLQARLMYVNATLNMGMGLLALNAALDAAAVFPEAREAVLAAAYAWEAFGFKERAVFILSGENWAGRLPGLPQLLFESGRFQEARRRARALGVRLREDGFASAGRVVPAEMTVRRLPRPALTAAWMAEAAAARDLERESVSPFAAAMRRLGAEWLESGGMAADAADIGRWLAAGRDSSEQAAAAYSLAVLAARQGRYEEALAAARRAVELMPESAVLWRLAILLAEGDAGLIDAGRRLHPDDPEIWLAALVMDLSDREADAEPQSDRQKRARGIIEAAVVSRKFSAGEMVRAADFLLRQGLPQAAAPAARYAITHGQGLESAYVVGLRCALEIRDIKWALSCALGGADHALNPEPFYRMLVNLNFARGALDRDLMVALEYLRDQFPTDTEWAERLGFVHFMQGDPGRALSYLGPVIRGEDLRGVQIETILLAAEAARLSGRRGHAVSMLDAAVDVYPDSWPLLNNLVFNLAQDAATRARALELLPELLKLAGDAVEALDTAGVVYLRAGRPERAGYYLDKALASAHESMYSYPYILMHRAELAAARGNPREALRSLGELAIDERYRKIIGAQAHEVMERIGRGMVERDLE